MSRKILLFLPLLFFCFIGTASAQLCNAPVDFAAFEKMAQAKAVSMSLGAIKVDFTAKQLEAIKQMYALIEK